MNSPLLFSRLVDLAVDDELPQELLDDVEQAAFTDSGLSHDLATLRRTLGMLRTSDDGAYAEESRQRILGRLFAQGVEIEPSLPEPSHFQFALPIHG